MHGSILIKDGMLSFHDENGLQHSVPLYSSEGFNLLSSLWLKVGWNERYHYSYTWMGLPVIQLPEDLLRLQEVLWHLKPDIIIETGVALGGSILFYASLCKIIGKGHVIGVEIDLHPPNRIRLEDHILSPFFTLVQGDSIDSHTLASVKKHIHQKDQVFVVLDSNHSKQHVLQEINEYAPLVTPNSYLVVADGFKEQLWDVPRGKNKWRWDNPATAVIEFLKNQDDFFLETPERRYNQSSLREGITHFNHAWLRRK